ncbi:hypothetical protein M0R04_07635 [Candidatus Dojkabacteria bacterium]|jgi:hypothetical protein|nr:hypothetical protein [Candidatus Dojkabacteria bacterium]
MNRFDIIQRYSSEATWTSPDYNSIFQPALEGKYVLITFDEFQKLGNKYDDAMDALDEAIDKCNELTDLVSELKHSTLDSRITLKEKIDEFFDEFYDK